MSHASVAAPRAPMGTRAARRALRAEKAQLLRWRRLVRARLDLVVASFAPPEPLGCTGWDVLPEGRDQLPLPGELASAVAVVTPIDPVDLMTRLRDLDRRLEAYGAELDGALEDRTEDVVRAMAQPVVTRLPIAAPHGEGGR